MLEQFPQSSQTIFNTIGILLARVSLETVLSADNAVALATLVGDIKDPKQQRLALNWGLILAFVLRIGLLLTATWIIQFWQFEVGGALYLLWLSFKHFWSYFANENEEKLDYYCHPKVNLGQVILSIAVTDLAFSLDSVTAAVALSSQTWLVITGCLMGIVTLRFLASLFVRWLEEFTYLEDAAYLTVFCVGIRLLLKALLPTHVLPKWMMLSLIAVLFAWGFSKRVTLEETSENFQQNWTLCPQKNEVKLPEITN